MLIRYKKSYEKIAMGLLSFVPSEKEIKALLHTVHCYEDEEEWQLFLWKAEEDIIGVIGVHFIQPKEAVITHLSVNPSYRDEGIGKKMIIALQKMLTDEMHLVPSEEIKAYFNHCFIDKEKEETGK
ncbi:MAG: GNAT family N-acetyltransferase [Sporolactobacillus sp.]